MRPGPDRPVTGGLWLLADMGLNIWALAIVKAVGLDFPAAQLVFLRAAVGLGLILPWAWRQRSAFRGLADLPLHGLRVGLSAIALSSSFFAIARVPFALFTAINFTRPLLLMAMAAVLLHETVGRRRWAAALVALVGVVIAINPQTVAGGWGIPALFLTVLAGTGAVIATRRLSEAPTVVLMTFYTAGLAALTAPLAVIGWTPVPVTLWPTLLAIGLFAQSAQLCFLNAHRNAPAAVLALLSYASLILSTLVGWLGFGEVPSARFWLGAALILAANLWVSRAGAGPRRSS